MCVITSVAISSVIVYLIKKPRLGLIYFAGVFRVRGFLAATSVFTTGAFLTGAFLTGAFLGSGLATDVGSIGTISTAGATGASTLYGATGSGVGVTSGGIGLPKKPFKNRNIMFSPMMYLTI